ncbi:Alpha/Beta hydrolase protein [Apiospora phragmitis]|uniref:Alpha/Beta hydrolase protein n=1 Tax=Apiospora phragmitis TaxID=2905665 RepID=A0ABR1TVW7_9PEZI
MPFPLVLKSKPDYVDLDAYFKPLPMHGHLTQHRAEYAAVQPVIDAMYDHVWALPDFDVFRQVGRGVDAVMPPGGPDRARDVVIEFLYFSARDGHRIELKVYKSPRVQKGAALMLKNAEKLGVNPEKIIVAGNSAGGNLKNAQAAAVAIEARDQGITGIVAQVLHFTQTCHPKFFPEGPNAKASVLNLAMDECFLDAYVPDLSAPDARKHWPFLANSHRGLPPALIQCGGNDLLRDDALAYAEALEAAGVDVEIHAYPGLLHCFALVVPTLSDTHEF